MSRELALSRRDVLKLAVTASVALALQSRLPTLALLRYGRGDLLALELTALLRHQDSAKIVGGEYLRTYPREADARLLLNRIAASLGAGDPALFDGAERDLLGLLDRVTREDFAADRIVNLQGWVLSVTEARICALTALI